MATHFTKAGMQFLRGLIRNNDRDWFEMRREMYERELKTPMLALIEEINAAMVGTERKPGFAPEHVRPPAKVMMRIYRDIRFSPDKRPYKRHVSAWWSRRGMEKTSGGGFYLHVSPKEVLVSAGVYMPEREQLLAIRRWMADNHEHYRHLERGVRKAKKGDRAPLTGVEAQALTRMPKGFPSDHPADELLRAKNWGVHMYLRPEAALEADFAQVAIDGFRRIAPLVDALNGAILKDAEPRRRPLF